MTNIQIIKLKIIFIVLFTIYMIFSNNLCYASDKNNSLSGTITNNENIINNDTGYFKSLKTDFIVKGNPIKLKDGRILITGNGLIFNPKTNKFSRISGSMNPIVIYNGCLLNNGNVLFVGALGKYAVELFPKIGNLILENLEKEKISKTVFDRPQGMSTTEYRHLQKKEALKEYMAMTEEELEKAYMPYLQKDPELLKEFNDYKIKYEDSMYGQIYNPYKDIWSQTGKINIRRNCQQPILLNDGKVLIVGGLAERTINLPKGIDDKSLDERTSKIEIFDPEKGIFKLQQNTKVFGMWMLIDMKTLKDNRVFMLFYNGCYMYYNPQNDTYSEVKHLPCIMKNHIILNDGKLLIFRGLNRKVLNETNILGVSIFDINTEEYKEAGELAVPRGGDRDFMFTAVELNDGNVLIFGGQKNIENINRIGDLVEATNSAEIYNPKTGLSRRISNMKKARINSTAITLDDGRVLIYDRKNGVELYIPQKSEKSK